MERKLKASSALSTASAFVLLTTMTGIAHANPHGGVVAAGNANIQSSGNKVDIHQNSDRVVIDWRGFDIGEGEQTQFHQPSSNATALNRVTRGQASQIHGNLSANGNVILVNPNGVVFGKNAKVDVNSLIATTADINNNEFMAGELHFNKPGNPDAKIINEGRITAREAGLVGLVAPQVENRGTIQATLGRVSLASGDTATIDLYGDGLVEVAMSDAVTNQLVSNSGDIIAEGGTVQITAASGRQIVDSLVSVSGSIHAPTFKQRNGKIIIGSATHRPNTKSTVHVTGTLAANGAEAGETGGDITITGDQLAIFANAWLDASGYSGGGQILIGGDYQGRGDTPTAEQTYIGKNSLITVNANEKGNGGKVIVWADDRTRFLGSIHARGGNVFGDGGFVETSGKLRLTATGSVFAGATVGNAGSWLLDPRDIYIRDDDGAPGDDTDTDDVDGPIFESDHNDDVVTTEALELAIASANVFIQTGSTGGQDGDIYVNDQIEWSSNFNLTLEADDDIFINAPITTTGSGNLNFISDNIDIAALVTGNGGTLTIEEQTAGRSIGIGSGAGNLSIDTNELGRLSGWDAYIFGGTNGLNGTSDNLTINTTHDFGDADLTFRSGGTVTLNGTLTKATGNATVNYIFEADANVVNGVGAGIVITDNGAAGLADDGTINITMNADKDANGDGIIQLTGFNVDTNNGTFTAGGGANPTTTAATGNAALNDGIVLNDSDISTGTAAISLRGTGRSGGGNTSNYGIHILNGASLTTTSGAITLVGTGGDGTDTNYGIILENSNTLITSQRGAISLTGTGDGSGDGNHGVYIYDAASVTSTGTTSGTASTITVTGTAADGNDNNDGVSIGSNSAKISSVVGAISVTGTGGAAAANGNDGVALFNTGLIQSTGAATITIDATAGANTSNAFLTVGGSNTLGGASATGNITVIADTVTLGNATARTSGTLTFEEETNGISINLGTDNGGTLVLDNTELGSMTAGTLVIGGTNGSDGTSGDMNIATANDFANGNLTFRSGSNITLSDTLTKNSGTGTVNYIFQADGDIQNANSADIVITDNNAAGLSDDGRINLTLNSDRDASGAGAISLTNLSFLANGGSITLGGGATPSTVAAAGHAGMTRGILLDGTTLHAGGGNVILRGNSHSNAGIQLDNSAQVRTANTGTVQIVGTGGTNANDYNYGVALANSSLVTVARGSLTITGQGGGTGAGTGNGGIDFNNSTVMSTGNNAGAVTITGTGGSGNFSTGISYYSGATVSTRTGAMTLNGTGAGNWGQGQYIDSSSILSTDSATILMTGTGNSTSDIEAAGGANSTLGGGSAAGNITIRANDYNGDKLLVETTATLYAEERTDGTTIGLGTGAGTLSINNTELGNMTAGSYVFGGTNGTGNGTAGTLTINTTKDFGASNLSFYSDLDIELASTLDKSAGAGAATYLFRSDRDIFNSNGADITASSGSINLTINSDYDGSGNSGITFTNSTITTGGGNVIMGGGTTPTTTAAVGTNETGILLDTTSINAGGGNISLRGRATGTTNNTHGIAIIGTALANDITTSGTGTITLDGSTTVTATTSYGVYLDGSANGVAINNGSGAIAITASGSANATTDGSGLRLNTDTDITSTSGALTFTSTKGGGVNAKEINSNATTAHAIGGGSGNITFINDDYTLDDTANVQTTGTITIEEETNGTSIGIGIGAGTLSLSETELGTFTASDIVVGSANAGAMSVDTIFDFLSYDVTLNASSITFEDSFNGKANTSTFNFNAYAGSIIGSSIHTITALNANFDATASINARVIAKNIDIGNNATSVALTGIVNSYSDQYGANLITGGPGNDWNYTFEGYKIRGTDTVVPGISDIVPIIPDALIPVSPGQIVDEPDTGSNNGGGSNPDFDPTDDIDTGGEVIPDNGSIDTPAGLPSNITIPNTVTYASQIPADLRYNQAIDAYTNYFFGGQANSLGLAWTDRELESIYGALLNGRQNIILAEAAGVKGKVFTADDATRYNFLDYIEAFKGLVAVHPAVAKWFGIESDDEKTVIEQ